LKYYNYEDLGITSTRKPKNTHLFIETTSGVLYIVDSIDPTKIYKSIDKGANWMLIETRSETIVSANLRSGIIYYMESSLNFTGFRSFSLNTGNDSISESLNRTAYSEDGLDWFWDGEDDWQVWVDDDGSDYSIYFFYGGTCGNAFTPSHAGNPLHVSFMTQAQNKVWYIAEIENKALNLHSFDLVCPGATHIVEYVLGYTTYELPSDRNQISIAYDGSDVLYFILKKIADSKNYLCSYSISGDSLTELGEYNVALQLNRSTASGVMEKAFHLTEPRIYQLHPYVAYQLYYIAYLGSGNVIIAITDNFLMLSGGQVYEYVDVSSYMTRVEFAHEITNYSEGTLGVKRDEITIEKGMFMQILGTFTTDELDRLFKGTYNFGDEAVGTEGTDIGWIDSKGGTDSGTSATIIASEDGHRKVIKFVCNGDNATDYYWRHNHADQTADGTTIELHMKYVDKGVGYNSMQFHGISTNILLSFYFFSNDNKFYWTYGNGAGGTTSSSVAATSDTWYHIRIVFDFTNDTYDIYLDGVLKGADKPFRADVLDTGLANYRFYFTMFAGANSGEMWADAIGHSWDANYDVGDNLVVEGGETDQVIFEGIIVDFDGERLQKVWLESPAKKELKNVKPRGNFSGRSDEIMTTLLSTYCKYITKGTFSVGTAMGTITYAGDKSLMTVLNELALFEKWIWKLDPQGRMFFNDGTTDTLVDLSSSDKLWMVKTGEVREPYNYFYLKGALVSGVQLVKELEEADDLTSQQLHGYNPFEETYASFNSQTILDQLIANVKARLKETPLVVEHWHYDADLGMLAHGETVTFVYDTNNVNVSSDQFLINRVLFKAKQNAGGYTIADELV
jgi:hypothetical protein